MTVLHFHSVAAKPQDAYNLLDLKHDWFDKVSQLCLSYHCRELYFTLVQHTCMYKILQYINLYLDFFDNLNIISKCFTFQQTAETFCKYSFDEQTNKQPGILCHVGTSIIKRKTTIMECSQINVHCLSSKILLILNERQSNLFTCTYMSDLWMLFKVFYFVPCREIQLLSICM